MSEVPEGTGRARVSAWEGPGDVVRWARAEMVASRAAVRDAARAAVAVDVVLGVLVLAFGLVPLLVVHPARPVLAVLEALWTALLVVGRRGRPVAAVVCTAPLLVGANVWTLAAIPLIVLSATRRIAPPRRAWRVVGVACAVVGVLTVARGFFRWESLPTDLAGNAVSAVLLLLLPALSGTLLGRRRPLVGLLRERNAYLEQTRALTAAAARMEERTRIAGEMHDLLGHRLSLISVHAGALELAAGRQAPALAGQAELLRTTAGTAMEELREILGVLRHTDLTDEDEDAAAGTGARGTYEDISALVTQSRQTGGGPVELEWSLPATAEVDARTRQAVHRVVREGLTNVLKHASGAPARVEVRAEGAELVVGVVNGAPREDGHSQGGTHSGLAGLHERVSMLGGTFAAGPLPGGGFAVTARLPSHDVNGGPLPTRARSSADAPVYGPPMFGTQAYGPQTSGTPAYGPPVFGAPAIGRGRRGTHAPARAEVLTWPRILGAGCAAVAVVLPTVGFLVVLLVAAVLR
ncbi:histidine kinase [Streptomyces sp. JV185]|uniref:sensor histidine kinase n=1 Tax=Streptomyces sp. JV185 TaxID=858638 RepID=UPI002E75C018|nr:histidine kinase [Streptomyces sp. JV185]MEE1767090.1 histidine kinase [Streptomyces sp. JV185]